jgi:hypothetical protein
MTDDADIADLKDKIGRLEALMVAFWAAFKNIPTLKRVNTGFSVADLDCKFCGANFGKDRDDERPNGEHREWCPVRILGEAFEAAQRSKSEQR